MAQKTRAELLANADLRFPDQNDEEISPEDSRSQAKESAESHLNLITDDHLLHLIHSETRPYKTGDVIYRNGEFYKSKTDHSGAFDIANWEFYRFIKDWGTDVFCNAGSYVNVNNALYKCLTDHTSGTFADDLDAGLWKKISDLILLTASGTDTYTGTLNPALTSLIVNQRLSVKFSNGNTGPSTLNIDSVGAIPIVKNGSSALEANDIRAGQFVELIYDGTNLQIIGSPALNYTAEDVANKDQPDGYAGLDAGGLILLAQLQAIIDDAETSATDKTWSIDQIKAAIAALVDSSPGTLDTLNELAAALGDDPNFATTITTLIGNKLDKTTDKADDATVQTGTNDTKWFSALNLANWWTWIKTQVATIGGVWTYTASPIVPDTPSGGTAAVNKNFTDGKYLDQSGSKTYAVATGTDTYTVTLTPAITAYAAGQSFDIDFTNTNTGASTININTLGAKDIKRPDGSALSAGDLTGICKIVYKGTFYQLIGGSGGSITFASEQEVLDHASTTKAVNPSVMAKHTLITKLNLYTNFS